MCHITLTYYPLVNASNHSTATIAALTDAQLADKISGGGGGGCQCVLRGDPVVETFDGESIVLLGTEQYTFSKHTNTKDPCYFNVEVKAGNFNPDFAVS